MGLDVVWGAAGGGGGAELTFGFGWAGGVGATASGALRRLSGAAPLDSRIGARVGVVPAAGGQLARACHGGIGSERGRDARLCCR